MSPPRHALALLLLLVACAPDPAPDSGSAHGPRVISLAPSVTRILDALGALDVLVAADDYSRRIDAYAGLPSVGGLFSPDLERTLELRPDLVLAVYSAELQGYVHQLRARGVQVEELRGHTLQEVLESFEFVAERIGRPALGPALVARVRGELSRVRESVRGRARPSVALVVERDPLYVAGGGSFTQSLIEIAGGRNVFSDLAEPYPRVGLEVLAERAPDVILDATIDPQAEPAALERARAHWKRFAWVHRVRAMTPGVATLPGPELAAGARALQARIHPRGASPGEDRPSGPSAGLRGEAGRGEPRPPRPGPPAESGSGVMR